MEDSISVKKEKRILNISLGGSIAFLAAEVICAWYTGSMAILMDCIYDIVQLVMIGPFLVLVPLLYRPVTEKRPYGYAQVESLFILIKYTALLVIEAVLVKESILAIAEGGNEVESGVIGVFELCVSAVCFVMFYIISRLGRETDTPAVQAEKFIWRLDSLSTLGVGLGFMANLLIGSTSLSWICVYVDPAIAILIAVILAKEPVQMIAEAVRNLILFAPEKKIREGIEKIAQEKCAAFGYKITFIDVIRTGRTCWIEVYFELDTDTIDVAVLKALDSELEKALEDAYGDVWLELIPDVEEFRGVNPAKMPERRSDRIAYIDRKKNKGK